MQKIDAPQLQWVSDSDPGIRRIKGSDEFRYVNADGSPVQKAEELERIRSLAIPPAYVDVWICASPDGHLQASGRDARGRKQYRYHPAWQAHRGKNKFDSLRRFGKVLPRIRARIEYQLREDATPTRQRVIATLARLLDTTWLRIGNTEYLRQNGSFGLTTLRRRHTRLNGDAELRISFLGKSGVRHELALQDRRVANVIRRCRELPGQELFQYTDADGGVHRIDSSDVNSWLAEVSQERISAKDFRTWHGSVFALHLLLNQSPKAFEDKKPTTRLVDIVAQVAKRLGNTPAICRKAYIHPAVLELGETLKNTDAFTALQAQRWVKSPPAIRGLTLSERQLLGLLGLRRKKS